MALVSGNSITAVHAFSALVGYAGLVALVHCVPVERRGAAWVLAFTIAVGPLWAPLAPTFMTDVPALAVQCWFLALAIGTLRAPRLTLARCAAVVAVGFLAISIRQYEAIPAIAFSIAAVSPRSATVTAPSCGPCS